MSSLDPSSQLASVPAHGRSRRVLAATLAAVAVTVMIAVGCSSDSGSSSGPTVPDRSSTTTEHKDTTTTDRVTTTTGGKATTTTTGKGTTTTTKADSLLGDGRSVVDLGSAGPAATEPQAEIAHWATIEQRTEAFGQEVQAMLTKGVPDDAVRNCLGGLGVATGDYLTAVRNTRALRIGPPPATPEQLQYADAESDQRLGIVRASLDQLDQLVLPHRTTS